MMIYRSHILICNGTGCVSSKSPAIMEKLQEQLVANGIDKEVKVVKTGCFGLCEKGPIVIV
ncbi:MAG TPA: NADH-quinone oxidoreductase subunit F, partial [Ruminiclostridium sp.]|nr:NADH-quinone oxidoreductase subunit F [Ruminiclostridium sp.]